MSDVSEFAQPQMSQPALDGLAEGNLFVELQVPLLAAAGYADAAAQP